MAAADARRKATGRQKGAVIRINERTCRFAAAPARRSSSCCSRAARSSPSWPPPPPALLALVDRALASTQARNSCVGEREAAGSSVHREALKGQRWGSCEGLRKVQRRGALSRLYPRTRRTASSGTGSLRHKLLIGSAKRPHSSAATVAKVRRSNHRSHLAPLFGARQFQVEVSSISGGCHGRLRLPTLSNLIGKRRHLAECVQLHLKKAGFRRGSGRPAPRVQIIHFCGSESFQNNASRAALVLAAQKAASRKLLPSPSSRLPGADLSAT